MSDFDKPRPNFRLVETRHGDNLQDVAAREMGDANRWPELIWLNNLIYPYITDHSSLAGESVILSGALIRVPASVGVYTDGSDTGQVYERDVALKGKQLSVTEGGDLSVASGIDNLTQQLRHRVATPRGQLRRHPEYGCMVWRMQGGVTGPAASRMSVEYVRAAIAADYRVSSVASVNSVTVGDAIKVTAIAEAIAGGSVDLTTSISLS